MSSYYKQKVIASVLLKLKLTKPIITLIILFI